MRTIKYIGVHCTATSPKAKISSILNYWRNYKGWKNPGYHFIIRPDGSYENIHPIERIANGVRGYNRLSIHIAYIGGIDRYGNPKDTRTPQQKATLIYLIEQHKEFFPKAKILGHRDFSKNIKKACPSFDAVSEYENL